MFVVSFRIPFNLLGETRYINGSAPSQNAVAKGAGVEVFSERWGKMRAEVIEARNTGRAADSFEWVLST